MPEIKSLALLFSEFEHGVINPTLQNYQATLNTAVKVLELASYDLPVLNDIFQNNQGQNDLYSKIESYLITNIEMPSYRYSKFDLELKETFDLDISKYQIRSILILIRCYQISKGNTSRATRELISNFTYIDDNKKDKTLQEIKEALPNVSEKYINSRYKDPQKINKSYLYAQMINANLYVLSYNHKLFTYSESNGRVFNSFSSLNKIFRSNELAFQMTEIDVMSANAQFVDKIFKFDNRWKGVYSNLMRAYEISRDEAKIKYNSTLNNHYLSVSQAKEVYANAGYDAKESLILAEATANNGKGNFYTLMANQEGQIMDAFISNNFRNDRQIRLHDGVWYDASFETVANAVELGIEFASSTLKKQNLHLNLKIDSYKTVLSTPPTEEFIVKAFYGKSKVRQVLKTTSFNWYSDNFLQLSATFNISKPVISKDGIYRSPTEVEFIERIQKLYKISKYLNGNDEHFKTCIEHLAKHIQFNKNYIYAVLPTWNFDINDALEYVKNRNWVYTGSSSLSLKDFSSKYHAERRQYIDKVNRSQLKQDLKRLTDAVDTNELYFIDKKKYYSAKRYEVGKLIDKVHDLIGVKREDVIKAFNESVHKMDTPYDTEYIGCQTTVQKNLKPPVSRRLQKKVHIFNKSKPTILSRLANAISNIDELQDITQLFTEQTHQKMNHKYKKVEPISAHEAFSEPIDYTHSVFANETARTAILKGKQFYKEYARFCRISELMNNRLWINTNNYDAQKLAMDGLSIMLYNDNYENVYAESMMSA